MMLLSLLRRSSLRRSAVVLILAFSTLLTAQTSRSKPARPSAAKASPAASSPEAATAPDVGPISPIVTHHTITLAGHALRYTATVGSIPLDASQGKPQAHIVYFAYTAEPRDPHRPLIFCFNGGPGSSSVWLQLGAIGPRRVELLNWGGMPQPPFHLVDNQDTWLRFADLVFIDPVGTGFSRASNPNFNKNYWSLKGDTRSVGEFIRLYLTRHQRWGSPLFLAGESYGTTRAAALAGDLFQHGIALNGVVLLSTVLDFHTIIFTPGGNLPYVLYLPTYTASAWYHHKLPPDLQSKPLNQILPQVQQWASTVYAPALLAGDALPADQRQSVIATLARYTGLSPNFIQQCHLRITLSQFNKELLRDQHRTLGRLDGRFLGIDRLDVGARPDYDPSMDELTPPFTAAFNQYVSQELSYHTDTRYETLSYAVNRAWKWDLPGMGYPDTSDGLRQAFVRNPYMKLLVGMGYFDEATPYFSVEYTLNHLDLPPRLRQNISTAFFPTGHMIYLNNDSRVQLAQRVDAFVQTALKPMPQPPLPMH